MTKNNQFKLFKGTDIRHSATDVLQPVSLEQVLAAIREPAWEVRQTIDQIRQIAAVSEGGARSLKTRLPYICATEFAGHLRQTKNFRQAWGMFVDLDHCLHSEQDYTTLSKKMRADNRVALFFRSPSGHGIKLLFVFDEPLTATKTYSDVYKVFAFRFASEYGLEKYLDSHTHDATRVCFMSYDDQAWANPSWAPVKAAYFAVSGLFEQDGNPSGTDSSSRQGETGGTTSPLPAHPDYARIIARLKGIEKPRKEYFMPAELEQALPDIAAALAAHNLQLADTRSIQYGRQLHIAAGHDKAVLNVYFGKKGYSVVRTTARGTNNQLAEAAELVVWEGIHRHYAAGKSWQKEIDRLTGSNS